MNKVYEKSVDLHVRKTLVYVKNGDTYAYADAACTTKISESVLADLFVKGVVIIDTTGIKYTPTSYKVAAGVGTLTYVKADGTTPTVAVLALLHSEEFVG